MQKNSGSNNSNEYLGKAKSLRNLYESELSRVELLAQNLKQQLKEKEEALQQVAELKKQLEESSALLNEMRLEAKAASEEAELSLLQLHQVQEELENYFFQSRSKDDLIKRHQAQQQRMKIIISKALS